MYRGVCSPGKNQIPGGTGGVCGWTTGRRGVICDGKRSENFTVDRTTGRPNSRCEEGCNVIYIP